MIGLNMKKFSDREGITKPKVEIQIASMDKDLRNCLWNAIYQFYLEPYCYPVCRKTVAALKILKNRFQFL